MEAVDNWGMWVIVKQVEVSNVASMLSTVVKKVLTVFP